MRTGLALLVLTFSLSAHAAAPAMKKLGVQKPIAKSIAKPIAKPTAKLAIKKVSSYYKQPALNITVAETRSPTLADVTIHQGFDGRSPQQALAYVRSKLTTPVAAQNEAFVNKTILDTHKAFTMAVNNVFVKGSPSNTKLTGDWAGAKVTILGVTSVIHPTVIMAKQPTDKVARYFVPAAGGAYEELKVLPPSYKILMKAQLEEGSKAGVRVSYEKWGASVLGGPLTTITELGSGTAATAQ